MAGEARRPVKWDAEQLQVVLRHYCGIEMTLGSAREVATLLDIASHPALRRVLERLASEPITGQSVTAIRKMVGAYDGHLPNASFVRWFRELEEAEFITVRRYNDRYRRIDVEAVDLAPPAEAAE